MSARAALLARRSHPTVTDAAPSKKELRKLVAAAGNVADHGGLRPWRLIEIRGEIRDRVGEALAAAAGLEGDAAARLARKTRRAPLLIAIVLRPRRSSKAPDWEQEAVASGVAHALTLLLDEAGWGVIWRTGPQTRHEAVHRAHQLDASERLLGWLYVGGKRSTSRRGKKRISAKEHLSRLR